MSIHIILGKPGSGKSMYATQRVFQEFLEGRRNIVTNLPLKPGALNEYIQKLFIQITAALCDGPNNISQFSVLRHVIDTRAPQRGPIASIERNMRLIQKVGHALRAVSLAPDLPELPQFVFRQKPDALDRPQVLIRPTLLHVLIQRIHAQRQVRDDVPPRLAQLPQHPVRRVQRFPRARFAQQDVNTHSRGETRSMTARA